MDSFIRPYPLVSILMPAFNAEEFINEAIESVLKQTYTDFEFLIINDGSTDETEKIICSFNDKRIIYYKHDENKGLIATLNEGIDLATGAYVARMDADDVSLPTRIEKQVAFMEVNKDCGLLGTWGQIYSREEYMKPCVDDMAIRLQQLKMNQFVHTSVMLRKSILVQNKLYYANEFHATEDYELWVRMSSYCKIRNLDDVLVQYRMHGEQVSSVHREEQVKKSNQIKVTQIENQLGITLTAEEKICYLNYLNNKPSSETEILNEIKLINKLKYKCKERTKNKDFFYFLNKQFTIDLNLNIRHFLFNKFVVLPDTYHWELLYDFIFYKISPMRYFKIRETIWFVSKCIVFYKKA
jgi:glycosyltransferase involved in cell wall biosynthesis